MRRTPRRVGSDGLHVRENGRWAEIKLSFFDHFIPTAIDATEAKHRRVYIDLFAGPGLNADKDQAAREFSGGALRVLQAKGRKRPDLTFTDAVLINLDSTDHTALERRVNRLGEQGALMVPRERIQILHEDANRVVATLLKRFHRLDYFLVFVDPEAPRQWPWSSVRALKAGQHKSVDFYCLLPLEMGLRRLLNFGPGPKRTEYEHAFDAFFGCSEWREIVERRFSKAQSQQMTRDLEQLYLSQLRRFWKYADHIVQVRGRRKQGLYRMVFASSHPAGRDIARWASRVTEEAEHPRLRGL